MNKEAKLYQINSTYETKHKTKPNHYTHDKHTKLHEFICIMYVQNDTT